MTALLDQDARRRRLNDRLDALRADLAEAHAQTLPSACGDDADRATNVEAHVRLAMLEDQITTIEVELSEGVRAKAAAHADVVEIGDVVTVDLGDGPEEFLIAAVEQAGDGLDVITPASPLGRALVGATVGARVEFRASRRTLTAQVLAIAA